MTRRTMLVLCVLLLLVPMLSRALQDTCSIAVQPGDDLQAAIDGAHAGAVVCLLPGEHVGGIVITKSLTLVGTPNDDGELPRIPGGADGEPAIAVETANTTRVVLRDLRLASEGCDGIHASGRADLELHQVLIEDCHLALRVDEDARISLSACEIRRTLNDAMWVLGRSQLTLTDCLVSQAGAASVHMRDEARVMIFDSTISGSSGMGIEVYGKSQLEIRRSSVVGSEESGLEINGHTQVLAVDNDFSGNGEYGLTTMSLACKGYEHESRNFIGTVRGSGNTVEQNASGPCCPGKSDVIWPVGFFD